MIRQDDADTVDFLKWLNDEIGRQEFQGNHSFFEDCLADELIFRRAKGAVIRKKTFLDDLQPDRYALLETSVKQIRVDGDSAVADVVVNAARHGEAPQEYRNIRVFKSCDQGWELIVWVNTTIESS